MKSDIIAPIGMSSSVPIPAESWPDPARIVDGSTVARPLVSPEIDTGMVDCLDPRFGCIDRRRVADGYLDHPRRLCELYFTPALVCLLARDRRAKSEGHLTVGGGPEIGTEGLWLCHLRLARRESALACMTRGLALTNKPVLDCATANGVPSAPPPGNLGTDLSLYQTNVWTQTTLHSTEPWTMKMMLQGLNRECEACYKRKQRVDEFQSSFYAQVCSFRMIIQMAREAREVY